MARCGDAAEAEIISGLVDALAADACLQPEVCHLNEACAFAVLERAHCYMEDHTKPFDWLWRTRAEMFYDSYRGRCWIRSL